MSTRDNIGFNAALKAVELTDMFCDQFAQVLGMEDESFKLLIRPSVADMVDYAIKFAKAIYDHEHEVELMRVAHTRQKSTFQLLTEFYSTIIEKLPEEERRKAVQSWVDLCEKYGKDA